MQYNPKDVNSIERYALELEGLSLRDKIGEKIEEMTLSNASKGKLGNLIEKMYFGYEINSRKEADFKEANMELKVLPLKEIKKKPNSILIREQQGLAAKERLVLSIINYMQVYQEKWESNSLFDKCEQLLLMFYISNKEVPVEEQVFKLIQRWQPSKEDLLIIQKDWQLIIDKIVQGKAHEISEGDTMYLGACTKGSTKEKSQKQQPHSQELATQRAFCFKVSYVNAIIEQLLMQRKYKPKKKEISIANTYKNKLFDEVILQVYRQNIGLSVEEILKKYEIHRARTAKNFLNLVVNDVAHKLFQCKLNELSEFKKANIEIKTIMLQPDGMPKESMSFEQIDYCELVQEQWEDSIIRDKFENKKHLWIIFKAPRRFNKQGELNLDEIILNQVIFWNMPYTDLEGSMKKVWQDTVEKVKKGDYQHFIKISDGEIGHIRPKAQNGDKDLIITPQGTYEKKKCFWLSAKYVKEQIEKNS